MNMFKNRIYASILDKMSVDTPHLVMVKDLEHRCCWITNFYAKQHKFTSHKVIIGKKDEEFFDDKYVQQFYDNDKIAFHGKDFVGFESTLWPGFSSHEIITQSTKCPLFDSDDKIIGSFSYCFPISSPKCTTLVNDMSMAIEKYMGKKALKNISVKNYDNDISLTAREAQTLYYTLQGMTSKKVGLILGISSKTVEYYLVQLKIKFNCQSKSALIEKSIENNYLSILPGILLEEK